MTESPREERAPKPPSTRERIQQTAIALFSEHGYEHTSLREIAEQLGVTKAALYYHFKTKEDIAASFFDSYAEDVDRICEWVGEREYGCVRFRKVAAWYGAALRMSKADKHRLTMLADPAAFDALVVKLLADGPPPGWTEWDARAAEVAVPAGPIAHW